MRRAPAPGHRRSGPPGLSGAGIPLDVTTLGIVRDRLRSARLELQQAYLHVQGHPEASRIVTGAGGPLRAALDAFEAAYTRGRL